MPAACAPGQLLFPFAGDAAPPAADSVILFHLPKTLKESLAVHARLKGTSVTRLLNDLISGYITADAPPKKKTGRGNIDFLQLERTKQLLREKHPLGVRAADIAARVGCSQARAARLLDHLSGNCSENANTATDFLVYEDDFAKPTLFHIAKDTVMTGSAERPGDGAYRDMAKAV